MLFPRRCVSCGKVGRYFCQKCTVKIKFITRQICPVCEKAAIDGITHPRCKTRYTLDGLTAFFHYDGAVRRAVKLLKYRFVTDLAKEFIDLIPQTHFQFLIPASPAGRHNSKFSILLPIPLHPSRFRFRGFNQAEVLGRLVADKLSIPIKTDILKRVKKTIPQVEMKDREKRLENMDGVFAADKSTIKQFENTAIILFDDVFTTGATLRAAANILKRAGAKHVWGIVMAHGKSDL